MDFSAWVLSIVGIVLLTLVVDIVLPEGQTGKYIKSVLSIITVFVIASPVPTLLSGDIDVSGVMSDYDAADVDEAFLQDLFETRMEAVKDTLESEFAEEGVSGVKIDISYEKDGYVFEIKKILLDTTDAVIDGSDKNINIKETVRGVTQNALDVPSDMVEVI